MRPLFTILALAILLATPALAQQGHLTLLTVAESDELATPQGGTADLYLDIRPGTGQIFIESSPLTKLDTQSSTRYANRVACAYAEADCSRSDFFYTIRANSPVVGGPSAGAAKPAERGRLTESILQQRMVRLHPGYTWARIP